MPSYQWAGGARGATMLACAGNRFITRGGGFVAGMRIGINAFPLRAQGGGGRFVFTGLLGALLRLDSLNRYLIFTHLEGLNIVQQTLAAEGVDPNAPDARARVIQIPDEAQIHDYRDELDVYFGPLNNLNPRLYDRPTLGMLLDIQEQYYPENFSKAELIARQEVYPEICRCSTIVLTISQFCKQTFVEKFGIDPAKIEVVYLAPQPALVKRESDDPGRWSGDPLPDEYLFYPANCYPHKNHRLLLEALAKLRAAGRCPNVVFSGYELPGGFPLRKEIVERGLMDVCRHFAELPVDELRYVYRNARAVVLPTLFEGFCIPAVEAMACGCPVICSDLAVLHEVAGENAIYFNSANADDLVRAIEELRNNPKLRESVIQRGRAAAARFSWDASGRQLLSLFQAARDRFAWGGHVPGSVARPRIGVMLRLVGCDATKRDATDMVRNDGVPEPPVREESDDGALHATVRSIRACGYPDVVIRCVVSSEVADDDRQFLSSAGVEIVPESGNRVELQELLEFARDRELALVGAALPGNRFRPSAFDSLAWAWLEDPHRALYLGEAFEFRRDQFTGVARLRLTGDQLWKMEGFLYPEMLFLNYTQMSCWGATAIQKTGNDDPTALCLAPALDAARWRWELLRKARHSQQLFMMRRTLADCDRAALPAGAVREATRAGMFDYYHVASENPVKVGLLRRAESLVKRAARVLPMKWQDRGTRFWYYFAR